MPKGPKITVFNKRYSPKLAVSVSLLQQLFLSLWVLLRFSNSSKLKSEFSEFWHASHKANITAITIKTIPETAIIIAREKGI